MVFVLLIGAVVIFIFFASGNVVEISGVSVTEVATVLDPNADIAPQRPLENPPEIIKAIYATNWSGGNEKKVEYFLDLLRTTELNAIVLDIKDYTGIVGYEVSVPLVKEYGAFEKRIPKINALIKRFHDEGVYVIGRIAVFQDNALVAARPDLALRSTKTGAVWSDKNKVHWLDVSATPVWDYTVDIARDALSRGFDEINIDYMRFPTDGDLSDITFPFYQKGTDRRAALRQFFAHLRDQLPYARISADIFGEAVVNEKVTSIGQMVEDTLEPFDVVAPMIYPSHYNPRFLGLQNAATNPYAVIRYSMDMALRRVQAYTEQKKKEREAALKSGGDSLETGIDSLSIARFRPWLQDFNLGATYDAAKVRAQITALDDSARAAAGCPGIKMTSNNYQVAVEPAGPRAACEYQPMGWMLWNASNVYTKGALLPE
jgi:hypothetical protein